MFATLGILLRWQKVDTLVLCFVGIKKSFSHSKAFDVLIGAGISIAKKYNKILLTWMTEDNEPAVRASEKLGMVLHNELVIYDKRLNEI